MVPLPLFSCVPNFLELRYGELPRIPIPHTLVNREAEMPERDPSAEEEVSSLLNVYILPSLAKRGGQAMIC
jgi:hypothetical protein